MNGAPGSRFIYAISQAGAERFLKEELAREHPELRFAFSRPGFVTFRKNEDANDEFDERFVLRSVFARAQGLQLGKAKGPDAISAILALARRLRGGEAAPPRLQVWDRVPHVPGEEPLGYDSRAWSRSLEAQLRQLHPEEFAEAGTPREGERVLTVVAVDPEDFWIGAYRMRPGLSPFAGGNPELPLPPEAPSRAYLKIEEAFLWTGVTPQAGDRAIEVGSAPGGASYALLKRGVSVVGIDPGEVAPSVAHFRGQARYEHWLGRAEDVPDAEFRAIQAQWLLLDMNMPPERALAAAERIARIQKESLKGLFLTIKLNQPEFASRIPDYLNAVSSWGMARVRATQLASHKREILIHAVPRRASAVGMSRSSERD